MLAKAYTVRFGCGWERMLFLFPCQILNTVMCCAPVYIYIYSRQFGLRADLFQHFPGNLKDWRTIWAAAAAPVESFLNGLSAPRDELTRQLTSSLSSYFCCPFDATTTAAMQAPLWSELFPGERIISACVINIGKKRQTSWPSNLVSRCRPPWRNDSRLLRRHPPARKTTTHKVKENQTGISPRSRLWVDCDTSIH